MTSHHNVTSYIMAAGGPKFICSCYFTHNIFLHQYRLHVLFHDEKQFAEDFRAARNHAQTKSFVQLLEEKGCNTDEKFQKVLIQVEAEIARRRNRGKECVQRSRLVREQYQRLHTSVYTLSESFLHPEFLEIVKYCRSQGATADGLLDRITEEEVPNVFSFPVFTLSFCQQFMEELDHFERTDFPKGRPNTMNNSGILLSETGFDEEFMNVFRTDYLMALSQLLFPEWVGQGLDSHRVFVVKYAMKEDLDLSYHFDNAEVTLNVCLGRIFTGGKLYFGPMKGDPAPLQKNHVYKHTIGRGILHRACHKHGALPITSGERYNLIMWMRSSSVRNQLCPMCDKPPKLIPNEGYGDGFTVLQRESDKIFEPCGVL